MINRHENSLNFSKDLISNETGILKTELITDICLNGEKYFSGTNQVTSVANLSVKDIDLEIIDSPSFYHSGVTLVSLFEGKDILQSINDSMWLSQYEIKCRLGKSTAHFRSSVLDPNIIKKDMSFITTEQLLRSISVLDARYRYELMYQVRLFYVFAKIS